MMKDIPFQKVEDLAVAIVPRTNDDEDADMFWDTYLINFKEEPLRSVLINSRGYGEIDSEIRKTTTMRYFFETIGPMEVIKIEPIQTDLFKLVNEYWVSFSLNNYLYDKKYVFVQGSLDERYFTTIPFLQRQGVMIR